MPLDFQVVPIQFTQGQDTRTQPKLVLPGKWQQLINSSISEDNTPRRRDGSQAVVTSAVGNGLATNGNELLVLSGSRVSAYSSAAAALKTRSGQHAHVDVAAETIVPPSGVNDSMDCARSGTVTCYVWIAGASFGSTTLAFTRDSINCMLVDETTGTVLLNTVLRTDHNARCPRVVYDNIANNGGVFYVFYESSSGGNKLYCRIVTTAGTVGTEVALVSSASLPIANFDACYFPQNGVTNGILLVYRFNDGTTSVCANQVTRSGTTPSVAGSTLNLVTAASIATAHIRGLTVATYLGGTAGVFILQDTATPGIAASTITTSFTRGVAVTVIYSFAQAAGESHITATSNALGVSGDYLQVFSDQVGTGAAGLVPISTVTVDSSLNIIASGASLTQSSNFVTGTAAVGPTGPWIYGKAFTSSAGSVYLPCTIIDYWPSNTSGAKVSLSLQNTFFLLDGTTGVVMAKALYGAIANLGSVTAVSTPCSCAPVGSSFVLPLPVFGQLTMVGNVNETEVGVARVALTPNTSLPTAHAQIGGQTFLAGGVLSSYDGLNVTEHGFNLFPEGIGAATAGAGNCTGGIHQVAVIAEWTDASGERHQSSVSPVVTIDTTASPNIIIAVSIPSLILTQKPNVTFTAFMTTVGGTIFYRTGAPGILNNQASHITTYNISISDAVLATSQPLYSQPDQSGTTLPSDAPPPTKALTTSQNRLWLLSADNSLEYRYSQPLENGVGLQFNGLFGDTTLGGLVPSESGGTATVSALDEKTIILCARKLYVIFGSPPDSSGANSTLSEPEEIPSPVGCSDPLSVLRMPQGLMFKSLSGWYVLGRDLSVSYIGDGVSTYDSYAVVSATLMGDRQECRFEVQSVSGGADGVTLVYSYLLGQWSVFTRGLNASHPLAARDALWYQPLKLYMWLAPSSGVVVQNGLFADTPGTLDDFVNTASRVGVACQGKTAWLRLVALNGFQRIRWLYLSGTSVSPSTVNTGFGITVDFDDVPSQLAPGAYTDGISLTTTVGGVVDLRHKLRRQKCKSVQFTFLDLPLFGSQFPLQGLQSLALEIGFRRGVNKLPAGQTA